MPRLVVRGAELKIKITMIKTLQVLAVMAALAVSGYALNIGMNRAERAECIRWQEQARQFAGFYLTSWQAAQCEHHGINVWQEKH